MRHFSPSPSREGLGWGLSARPSSRRTIWPLTGHGALVWDRATWIAVAMLLIAAFLIRGPHFGDPAFKLDEQFYLLVGDRMLHGAVPYVDIWDRKPIGLFLIYAACRLLGGAGFVQYQIVATLFAAGTAWCVLALTRRHAGPIGGTIAGLVYLLWLEVAEGGGGQSPVFYGLFVAGAAALLIGEPPADVAAFRKRAFAAMALIGIGIQIKYTVLFEGLFFGLVAAWGTLRRAPSLPAVAIETGLLALTALLPTLAVIGVYAAIGHLHDFWFANFTSISLRGGTPAIELHYRTQMALLRLAPLAVCAAAAWWQLRRAPSAESRRWQWLMLGWMASAVGAFFALGVLYSHYLLPVFLPFAAAGAPIYRRWPLGAVLAGMAMWLPASTMHWPDFATTARSQRQMAALTALVPPDVSRGCLHVFDGPPALYYLTNACMVTRFPFPDHLSAEMEAHATGIDAATEIRRILAVHPQAITISDVDVRAPNRTTFAIMRDGLARDYRLAGKAWVDERFIFVFVRR